MAARCEQSMSKCSRAARSFNAPREAHRGTSAIEISVDGFTLCAGNDVIVMTPVAAHSLFDRSMVLPSSSVVEVTVSRDRPVRVNVDKTDLGRMTEGDTIRISRHDRPARFVSLGDARFSSLVRDKFGLD